MHKFTYALLESIRRHCHRTLCISSVDDCDVSPVILLQEDLLHFA